MKKIVLFLIEFYRYGISPFINSRCKFTPTCSLYALIAIEKYGVIKGGYMSIRRILRCHPFNKKSGYDPVP